MKKLRKGFTLVELIIVLAIAGLIISLVFVAASAAQRNGRDTTRRADTQRLATAIEQWSANNNGTLPDAGFGSDPLTLLTSGGYLDAAKFKDPSSGNAYNLFARSGSLNPNEPLWVGYMFYVKDSPTAGKYTIVTPLESGQYTYTP